MEIKHCQALSLALRALLAGCTSKPKLQPLTLGKSRQAKGTQRLERTEVNMIQGFESWVEQAKPRARVSILVKPYAGLPEAPDYPWQVKEVRLLR